MSRSHAPVTGPMLRTYQVLLRSLQALGYMRSGGAVSMNGRAVISFLPKLPPLTWFRTTAPLRRQDQHLRRGDPSDRSHDARGDGRRPGPLRPRDLPRRRRDGRRVSHIRRRRRSGIILGIAEPLDALLVG